jgi:DNA recombination protein RmuC
MLTLVYILFGIAIGFVLGKLLSTKKGETITIDETQVRELAALQAKLSMLQQEKVESEQVSLQLRARLEQMAGELSATTQTNKHLQTKLEEQKQDLQHMQERMKTEFENLANKILEEKSQRFTDQNRQNIDIVLQPLKERIKDFEDKVQKVYDTEAAERNTLKGEIKQLMFLNQQMHTEAQNLTRALKGDNKSQGNWGEFILESILEKSGLVKGREYQTQESITNEEGRRLQPDVVIYLPDNKNLIIDSKVSLVAFEKAVNAEDDIKSAQFIKEHIQSIRSHIKQLSDKKYQEVYGVKSLDFVLLFVPIEAAFSLSVQSDPNLFSDAFEKNIVVVSPTTLLATLKTVSNIWRNENQSRNAFEIAKKAGDLYDKFVGFTGDLIEVGKQMDKAKASYGDAMRKLTDGPGNLIRRTEELKKIGAQTTKSISPGLLDRSEGESV